MRGRDVSDIPIFHKVYALYKRLYQMSACVPKPARYTLWSSCEKRALALLETVLAARFLVDHELKAVLLSMSRDVDILKVLIRLCGELHIIDMKKVVSLQELVQEIGRMVGGWLKSY